MGEEKLYIKNMVCNRCIMVVKDELDKLGLGPLTVTLGEALLPQKLDAPQRAEVSERLNALGFELIDDKRMRLIEKVKNVIIELIYRDNCRLKTNLSDYISVKLHYDYNYVSGLFSEIENTTIEKYYIAQKTERVKELLVYDELALGEIADMLNYSSTAHLSAQFKKVTGLTPSHFKQIKDKKRKPLDEV